VGKATKYNFAYCAAGKRGTFDSILNLKYFIQAVKFRWPPGSHITHVENRWNNVTLRRVRVSIVAVERK
jgi:hypothetical protein